jgi:catechol 2,3-dioxygenase-like lactoylglutathione lyase family enzyme
MRTRKLPGVCAILLLAAYPAARSQQSLSRPAITGIAHISLYEPDMKATRDFYTNLLGWPESPAIEARNGARFLVSPTQYIETELMPATPPSCYIAHIAYATSDANQLLRYLKAKGVQTPAAISRHSDGSQFFFVHDPEGYSVEFVQRPPEAMPATHLQPVSTHIIHAGLAMRDRAAQDRFYKDILGFHLYWHSVPQPDGTIGAISMQVPDGTDWLEYMLAKPDDRSIQQLTSKDHFAPGVVNIDAAQKMLEDRGWQASAYPPKRHGNDAKWQLNPRDPAGTRVELMEFGLTGTPLVPFTGRQPIP